LPHRKAEPGGDQRNCQAPAHRQGERKH
jgi:hypothetical protein